MEIKSVNKIFPQNQKQTILDLTILPCGINQQRQFFQLMWKI